MNTANNTIIFDHPRAIAYDTQFQKLAPIKEVLHFLTQMILMDLPANARILCVGAGTGSELIYLAKIFPNWQFTALDPAKPMLDVCKQRVAQQGFLARCSFHNGYLSDLPDCPVFDAATCFLVSHFLTDQSQRTALFKDIATRLGEGGILVSADHCADSSTETYQNLHQLWCSTLNFSDLSTSQVEKMTSAMGKSISLLPPLEVALTIQAGGFTAPVEFLQTLMIHGWYAQKSP